MPHYSSPIQNQTEEGASEQQHRDLFLEGLAKHTKIEIHGLEHFRDSKAILALENSLDCHVEKFAVETRGEDLFEVLEVSEVGTNELEASEGAGHIVSICLLV